MIYWPIWVLVLFGCGGLGAYAYHLYKKPVPSNKADRNQEYKVGLIGAGSAIFGVVAGSLVSIFIANVQIAEARHDDVRKVRGEVYVELMRTATEYGIQTSRFLEEMKKMPPEQAAELNIWGEEAKTWYAARNKFFDAATKVYVYGSDEALVITLEFQNAFARRESPEGKILIGIDLDQAAFEARMERFRKVFCREVPSDPRPGCR